MSQPRKIIYKDDVSESESAAEEEDDDSDFGAKKTPKKSPKKKAATPKKGKKVVSKKKTPAKVTKFLIDSIVRFVNECTQTCTSPIVFVIIIFVILTCFREEKFSQLPSKNKMAKG